MVDFPWFLKKLSRLHVMVLRGNQFHGPIACPHTKNTWHKLQIIDLALNNFSGLLPGKWFKTFVAMIFDEVQDYQSPITWDIHLVTYIMRTH